MAVKNQKTPSPASKSSSAKPKTKTLAAKASTKGKPVVKAKPATTSKSPVKVPAKPVAKPTAKVTAAKAEKKAAKPQTAKAPVAKEENKPAAPTLPKATVAQKPAAKPAAAPSMAHAAVKPAVKVGPQTATKAPPPAAPAAPRPGHAAPQVARPAGTQPKAAVTQAPVPAAQAGAAKKPVNSRHGFKTGESIVYPAHGVGKIVGIEEQEIAGITLELFVIQFEKDKMTLRVPTSKLANVGMRKLAEDGIVHKAMETLKGKARIKRTMWSRRAQEYEAKINSGDLVSIAEVVRDLYRSEAQPEQSYSERQLYEAALDRMAREIAAVDKVDERGAMQRITEVLSKSAKGRRAAEEEAQAEAATEKAA